MMNSRTTFLAGVPTREEPATPFEAAKVSHMRTLLRIAMAVLIVGLLLVALVAFAITLVVASITRAAGVRLSRSESDSGPLASVSLGRRSRALSLSAESPTPPLRTSRRPNLSN